MLRRLCLLAAVTAITLSGCASAPPAQRQAKNVSFAIRTAVYHSEAGYRKVLNPRENDEWRVMWVNTKNELDENDVETAVAVRAKSESGQNTPIEPAIAITMTSHGRKKLEALTSDHVSYSRLAIYINKRMVMSPRVGRTITDGKMIVIGDMTDSEAERIAAALSGRRYEPKFTAPR